MANDQSTPGVAAGRLSAAEFAANFGEAQGALDRDAAVAEAERCLFCRDAPCVTACPTAIDVPGFIEGILDGALGRAAEVILGANILGGMCARVCPVDTLCEGACVYVREGQPAVAIARLQRHATDWAMSRPDHPFDRAPATGKRIAVVGAGPAGLACAHRLARYGHTVVIFEAKAKPGGLNEYGIAAYKTPDGFAQAEIGWLLGIGGIEICTGQALGRDTTLEALREEYDAVFLGLGLAGANALRAEGEELDHVHDAIDFIAGIRQAPGWAAIPVGRDVVVIGGGMTAVDAAVQARLLGAETVTIAYRQSEAEMAAHDHERVWAVSKGVRILTGAVPLRILGTGRAEAVEFQQAAGDDRFTLPADQVLKAIGQCLVEAPGGLRLDAGRIATDAAGRTSLAGVWAGGDCSVGASDLTVIAVDQGQRAAEDIHASLTG